MQQRHADLSNLKVLISEVAQNSGLSEHLQAIVLDIDDASADGNFRRIVVEIDTLDGVSTQDMEALILSIETIVTDFEERFPSVRFAEAA